MVWLGTQCRSKQFSKVYNLIYCRNDVQIFKFCSETNLLRFVVSLEFEHFEVSIIDMIHGYRFVILGIFGKFGI